MMKKLRAYILCERIENTKLKRVGVKKVYFNFIGFDMIK